STFSPQSYSTHRDLHSFPTRRSSDLRHDPRERRRISGARAVGRAQVREDPQRQGVSAGPEKVIRDQIRALTAYHVQSAEGMVKLDRKSTRLNSSHDQISYAVFCLKKK